ncbi:reverse transcriptase [Phytophthora megakarya]|uniref:Reverse transcriptase n=1 Tax=Phytophthora megakarya TaxID=4795 RepID=A0A225UZF7_9STRA|nr:reverse transcriptase [Phytophthora megakarya]
MIRHDRKLGFISDFFRAFHKILGQRQRATMAYRPQANGTAKRIVQTATRALKMYVRDLGQKDWDEHAERLTFAINTSHDRRYPSLFGACVGSEIDTGGYTASRMYKTARSRRAAMGQVNARLKEAITDRADRHNEDAVPSRQKDQQIQRQARDRRHRVPAFPVVHVSKLKLVKDFPDRPRVELSVDEADRLDFDETLLPEDSWVPDLGADEYEVERISDVRCGKKTRFGRIYREFLIHWAEYDEPTWVDEADLNCGTILNAFLRERANRNRFTVMQSHEEM